MKKRFDILQETIRGKVEDFEKTIISIRESREPFFGVQTLFAPAIDALIERRKVKGKTIVKETIELRR